jgi:hypothetical protein
MEQTLRNLSARFKAGKGMIDDAAVRLAEQRAPDDRATFVVELLAFCFVE